jgi:hypothetical protein
VPIEVATDISVGSSEAQGSLTVSSPQTILLRKDVGLMVDNGVVIAKGERDCKENGNSSILFDAANPSEPWAAISRIPEAYRGARSSVCCGQCSVSSG